MLYVMGELPGRPPCPERPGPLYSTPWDTWDLIPELSPWWDTLHGGEWQKTGRQGVSPTWGGPGWDGMTR